MRLQILKRLFQEGIPMTASVITDPDTPGNWLLCITKTRTGDHELVTVAEKSDQVKRYVRYGAAVMDAHRIGFRELTIAMPDDMEPNGAFGSPAAANATH
ncbi:hypothetical protein ACTMQQ_28365 [Pseudomonas syringae pv. aptata]|uniref:hypothetical protein n=1 Tax=Pseudomonas syringae TaxID=317 RepID=UPI003F8CA7F7